MDWIQFLLLFATFVTLFTWNLTESRSDRKENMQIHRETNALIEANRKETYALIEAIRQDIKDFHARLCVIEDRNRREK